MSERIVINPEICNGRPVVRGTGITAQTVLEFLAAGDSVEDVLEEYPTLKKGRRAGVSGVRGPSDGESFLSRADGMNGFLLDENLPSRLHSSPGARRLIPKCRRIRVCP
jgi:hypothetical protein